MTIDVEEAKQLSWIDLSVYTDRRRKAAVALIEVAEVVRDDQMLSSHCSEFLRCFDFLVEADSADFTSLWSEPYAYNWSRTADELLRQWRLEECGIDSLVAHLDLIKLFASGLAILQNSSITFGSPLTLETPLAIPGIPMTVSCDNPITIEGVRDGCLMVQQPSGTILMPSDPEQPFDQSNLKREFCPLINLGDDATVRLHPAALKLPSYGAEEGRNALPSNSLQNHHRQNVQTAVGYIKQYLPTAYSQLRYAARIIALKSSVDGGPSNSSYSRMPGALLMCACECGYQLAEDIIHESYHNRLYAIEEAGGFFLDDRIHSTNEARFYSPWRNDPRPLYGVFHAVYVFSRVQQFWFNVLQDTSASRQEFAAQRCATLSLQLEAGLAELESNADFSDLGEKIFGTLQREVEEMRSKIDAIILTSEMPRLEITDEGEIVPARGVTSGVPVSVLQAVEEHRQLFEQNTKLASSV